MRYLLLIFISIFIYVNSFSCDCKEMDRDSAVYYGLKYSNLVFTGNLLYSDYANDVYCFEIFEIFKGDYFRDTIWGEGANNCSCFPSDKGIWIVYANKINDTTIDMNGCLYSMSLQQLEVAPPPREDIGNDENGRIELLEYKIQCLESKSEHIAMWFADYEKLKKYKAKSQKIDDMSTPEIIVEEKINYQFYIILFLLTTNLILLIVLIRKKK